MTTPSKRITFEEAEGIIADIARNGDGAERMRALKMVMGKEGGVASLPPPLDPEEVVERMARLMRAVGAVNTQFAYRRAFPASKKEVYESMPRLKAEDMSILTTHRLPTSVKHLYRMFPEIKAPGYPAGFPQRAGLEVRAEWCRKKALEILRDRENAKAAAPPEVADGEA